MLVSTSECRNKSLAASHAVATIQFRSARAKSFMNCQATIIILRLRIKKSWLLLYYMNTIVLPAKSLSFAVFAKRAKAHGNYKFLFSILTRHTSSAGLEHWPNPRQEDACRIESYLDRWGRNCKSIKPLNSYIAVSWLISRTIALIYSLSWPSVRVS